MTDDEYDMRMAKVRNKMAQLREVGDSMELTFPPIDISKEWRKLGLEVEDMINEIEVADFLEHGAGNNNIDKITI